MAKNVVCKKCNNLVNDWCEKVIDSPDQDMQRDCQYLCKKYCMGDEGVFVKCRGVKYNPVAYELTFDTKGRAVHYVYLLSGKGDPVRELLANIENI